MSKLIGHRGGSESDWTWLSVDDVKSTRRKAPAHRLSQSPLRAVGKLLNTVFSSLASAPSRRKAAGKAWLTLPVSPVVFGLLLAVLVPLGLSFAGSADATAPLMVNKRCSPEGAVGMPIAYIIEVSNSSATETLTIDSVGDPLLGGDITGQFSDLVLGPGEMVSSATIYRFVQESDPRPLVNTVTVNATGSASGPLTTSDSCPVDVPHLTIKKDAVPSGTKTVYTFTITNDGNVSLLRSNIVDNVLGDITASFPLRLEPGQTAQVVIEREGQECENVVDVLYESARFIGARATAKVTCTPEEGSIRFTKIFEVGPFTGPTKVCFRLDPAAGIDPAEQCATSFAAGPGPGEVNATFQWRELPFGPYTITETLVEPGWAYDPIDPISVTIDSTNQNVVVPPIRNPLRPGTLRVEKRTATGALWSTPAVTFYVCRGSLADCTPASATFVTSIAVGDGNPNPSLPIRLPEDFYTVCEVVPAGYTPDPSRCQVVQVFAGNTNPSGTTAPGFVSFTNIPTGGEGCTPGFWKNHRSLWDQPSDAVSAGVAAAIAALGPPYSGNGTTESLFRTTFGLTSDQMTAAGLPANLKLLGAINLGGGGFNKLARHGVAGLLSSVSVNYPYTTASVLTSMHDAVIALSPEPLATQLAAANDLSHENCPS